MKYLAHFTRRQTNISSAAAIISAMIAISRVLGLLRNRVLAHFFNSNELSLYFAAFRLPEIIFNVLVFGAIAAAFIPTFTAYLTRREKDKAWEIANRVLSLAIAIFFLLSLFIFIFATPIYRFLVAGFTDEQVVKVVFLARILIFAQGFFLLSYFLTGILESLQRFLVPAIAPIVYNLGIIGGTMFLAGRWGLVGPVIGVVIGAFFHFLIQVPLAFSLGFRPRLCLDLNHPGVKKVVRLAGPRMIELTIIEAVKSIQLFLASLISTGAYTWFTFASSLQLLPVALFGTSLAKATLPTLSSLAATDKEEEFKTILLSSLNQILFLTIPASVFLMILRIPAVRLVFGAARFTWESTLETGYTLSVFCFSIFSQSLILLLARAFYALQQTKKAVKVSVLAAFLNIFLSYLFILVWHLPVWGLALSFSLTSLIQVVWLFLLLDRELGGFEKKALFIPLTKIIFSSFSSGALMFFLLKVFDRSVWDKRLSFLGRLGLRLPTTFEYFVLDTRYTVNLIFLTTVVALVGLFVYLGLASFLKIKAWSVLLKTNLRWRPLKLTTIDQKEG